MKKYLLVVTVSIIFASCSDKTYNGNVISNRQASKIAKTGEGFNARQANEIISKNESKKELRAKNKEKNRKEYNKAQAKAAKVVKKQSQKTQAFGFY